MSIHICANWRKAAAGGDFTTDCDEWIGADSGMDEAMATENESVCCWW